MSSTSHPSTDPEQPDPPVDDRTWVAGCRLWVSGRKTKEQAIATAADLQKNGRCGEQHYAWEGPPGNSFRQHDGPYEVPEGATLAAEPTPETGDEQ